MPIDKTLAPNTVTSSPAPTRSAVDILAEVDALREARLRLNQELTAACTTAIAKIITPGLRLDLRREAWPDRSMPNHLFRVKTTHGNDRGTHVFEVVDAPSVDVDMNHPGLSTWTCRALPVSETTGKAMSGRTAKGHDDTTVRLSGQLIESLSLIWDDAPADAELLAAFIEGRTIEFKPAPRKPRGPRGM